MSVTKVTMLSSAVRTSVGPKMMARLRASILFAVLCSTTFFRWSSRNFRVSKWWSGSSCNCNHKHRDNVISVKYSNAKPLNVCSEIWMKENQLYITVLLKVSGRLQLKCDGTWWCTGGEVKGKLANGVGSQYPSHYLGTWCIQVLIPLMRTPRLPVVDWTDNPRLI